MEVALRPGFSGPKKGGIRLELEIRLRLDSKLRPLCSSRSEDLHLQVLKNKKIDVQDEHRDAVRAGEPGQIAIHPPFR